MKLKKVLAGVMAFAMTATMLPGGMFAVPDTVEAKTVTSSLPEPKYEMDFEGNLDVTGQPGVTVGTYSTAYVSYVDGARYGEGHAGQALNTEGNYGIKLENVSVDDTYTISAWVNLQSAVWPSPIISASHPNSNDNWVTMAGADSAQYMLWCDPDRAPGGNNIEFGRKDYILNDWVEYTLSVNGNTAVLYENGVEVISGTNNGVLIDSPFKNITFGVNPWNDAEPTALYDDIKIYDEALSAEQVRGLFNGATVTLSAEQQYVRENEKTEVVANVSTSVDDVTVEWTSDSEYASVDTSGVITGVSEGTATITATVKSGDKILASGSIDMEVLPEKGNLIADFTFDEDADVFKGAGAAAKKVNNNGAVYVDDGVLVFNSSSERADWLDVKKEDASQLLAGVEEFTVSYDSNSEGTFGNNWTFYADNMGAASSERGYFAIVDQATLLDIERGSQFFENTALTRYESGWKHVDVVFARDKTEVYIDGNLAGSRASQFSLEEALQNNGFIWIGHSDWGAEYWKGQLDNYKIYDYALTAEEIASTPVSNIEVTADSSTMFAGNTLQLAATVTPDSATDKTVEWTSSDPEVAEVNENGLVTAKKAGNVTITATAQDKDGKSGSIDLTVKAALTYHEAKDPTCTEPGNIEYWTDAEGNYYLDATGETSTTAEAVKTPATGHSYGEPEWNWVKSEDGNTYASATATFACEKYDDTQQVTDNEITHVIENGQVTYSAEVTFSEQTYKITTTEALVLTATEEVPATCTEAGTKAYWTDQFGNRYSDAEGQNPVTDDEELVIPETGHDYISSGRWIETEDGYSLDVTFTCKHGDDTATVPATVTSSSSEGMTVYTAVAEYKGTQFTYTKEVQDSYTLTVVDGTIEGTEVTTNNYGYNDVVTVVADAEKGGQHFAGWYIGETLVSTNTTYTFCIAEDKILTAKYVDEEPEATAVVSLRMSEREAVGSNKERVIMTVEWSMPDDYYMVGAGIVRSYNVSDATQLTLDKVDGSNIRQNPTNASCRNGSMKYTLTMSATTKLNPVNAVGYLIYRDAEGVQHTIYTDLCISPASV